MIGTQNAVDGSARAPRDIPVIMSRPMVLGTLEDRKTETRRHAWSKVRKPRPVRQGDQIHGRTHLEPSPWQRVSIGDRLWVRESLRCAGDGIWRRAADDTAITMDRSDARSSAMIAWAHHQERSSVPSIHMPRWASRLTLIVTGVKVEPLWSISERDCEAEGVVYETADPPFWYVPHILPHDITAVGIEERADLMPHAVQSFRKLWIHLHGREGWDGNPEVVAISFRVIKANIDAAEARAAA